MSMFQLFEIFEAAAAQDGMNSIRRVSWVAPLGPFVVEFEDAELIAVIALDDEYEGAFTFTQYGDLESFQAHQLGRGNVRPIVTTCFTVYDVVTEVSVLDRDVTLRAQERVAARAHHDAALARSRARHPAANEG